MLYSPSKNSFYLPEIHGDNIPSDAIAITDAEYAALMNGQSEGKAIAPDASGRPSLVGPSEPTPEQLQAKVNAQSRAYLSQTDWYIIRKAETGIDVPDEVTQKRADARAAITD